MKRLLLASALALAWTSIASAQTYPSPHFNDVTIDGTINTLALPTSAFAGVSDTQTFTGKTISGASNTLTNIGNSSLVNTAVTVNGITCTLGGTCSITAPASGVTVGTTTITGGTSGNIEYNNAGFLGEKTVTGTGSVVLGTSPSLTGTITIGGVPMSFPSSGNIVGTSDTQTLTNKSIDAAEINSGTLSGSRMPVPGASSLGSVFSSAAPSNQFATGVDTSGNVTYAQPSFTQGGTGAVTQTMLSKLGQLVWIKDYGAVCDGSTDDTTAIQDAWNYAASVGKSVYLGGVGSNCLFSKLVAPTPSSGSSGNRSALVGNGFGSTVLTSNLTSGCAISISATYGTNSDYNENFSDFSLVGPGATIGTGVCLTNITRANFSRILVSGFNNDVLGTDCINIEWDYPRFLTATVGVNAAYGSNTHPNAWTFISPSVAGISTYGMIFQNPANLNIVGGDWENNGWGNSSAVPLYIDGNPAEGSQGLSMKGGYFSFNNGLADILIDQNSGTTGGTHDIEGVEFQRVDGTNYTLHNVELNNNGTGTTTVRIAGSGFAGFNTYTPNSGRAYITAATVASANYVFSTGGNYYQSSTEAPSGAYFNETAWATWTPTLGCGTGSLTTASATGRYKRLSQKTVAMQEVATISANGTCAAQLRTSVPATPASQSVGSWKDVVNGPGGQCALDVSGTQALCTTGSGAYPLSGSSGTLWISQTYETQ